MTEFQHIAQNQKLCKVLNFIFSTMYKKKGENLCIMHKNNFRHIAQTQATGFVHSAQK